MGIMALDIMEGKISDANIKKKVQEIQKSKIKAKK